MIIRFINSISLRKQAQSFNIAEYLELPKRILVNSPYPDQQFRQDGAITHTMSTAMTWLKARFFQQLMYIGQMSAGRPGQLMCHF